MNPQNDGLSPDLLHKTYQLCHQFTASLMGRRKTRQLLENSYRTVLPYFPGLRQFRLDEGGGLEILTSTPSDKELLAFAVWMQQFMKEVKKYMVGLGRLRIEALTEEIRPQLESVGFYEYFYQSAELDYS